MSEEYRTLEAQGPDTVAGLCEITGWVVDSIDELQYHVPLTLACNRHRHIFQLMVKARPASNSDCSILRDNINI